MELLGMILGYSCLFFITVADSVPQVDLQNLNVKLGK